MLPFGALDLIDIALSAPMQPSDQAYRWYFTLPPTIV